jgi:hypothetical protein
VKQTVLKSASTDRAPKRKAIPTFVTTQYKGGARGFKATKRAHVNHELRLAAMQLRGLPIGQRLQPNAQGHASTLGGGLVPLPLAGRHPDVYTHASGVFQRGSTPRSFGLGHGLIMYSQIILDKPPVRVFNVLTLNKERT